MEAAPPTYEKATLIDIWDIVARYVPSNDLCSAASVCSQWHMTFVPHLWGAPASHFSVENDRVYVALTKFKRTLQTARLFVRSLTHTLHLPPAHAEIYNGPHADWLSEVLDRLPNLQTLIVRGLPFFDHAALLRLPGLYVASFSRPATAVPFFGLRLLDASRCSNTTSSGLAHALSRLESLMYLDLSFTYPARDSVVLHTLGRLYGLQVLKLRGVSLSDESLKVLAESIALRVRSLDVRDNRITDRGIRILLDYCFANNDVVPSGGRSPALLPYLGTEMLHIYQGEDFEGFLRKSFTSSFVSRLAIEDVPDGGITHLYISANAVTVEGASGLVRSGRLHVLDLGPVAPVIVKHLSASGKGDGTDAVNVPGMEKLTPLLAKHAAEALSFLRIDHALVTKDVPVANPDEVVQGRVELGDTSLPDLPDGPVELATTSAHRECFEMPTAQTPRHELPGDPMQIVVSPAVNGPVYPAEQHQEPLSARRGSAFAPEVLISPLSPLMANVQFADGMSRAGRPRTYSSVATERKARLQAHTNEKHNLHPAMLPHVSTLMLTDVPAYTDNQELSNRLILFIKHCAEEAELAKTQAHLDYALPPGRKGHTSAIRQSMIKTFALRKVVLEIAPEPGLRSKSKASAWQHIDTRSMTEDRDSEALWSAAETDFSFFGEGEELNFPSLEPRRSANGVCHDGKEVILPGSAPPLPPPQTVQGCDRIDTVARISAFRTERKLAHRRALQDGGDMHGTEGYWDGVVQVVRPGSGTRADEELDYYGNACSNGYLYR
ncbi:hypothetical protein BAUCODRAFT_71849 [Baudoinia panamericana UAMH 10762]|uniref:F-box domain-containing protein n=1 Tax=Baudoinia panamericana (strain UAMH 10762) TaxID=717646 RepID=M2MFX8_BAUPA|nr:uncharacterized protein BAUCODRAFT_71849 [Baudoinia panamericana UAMH 10762]EMC95521.1 hypothetical protein BAUCODRAFT_71849 [Baudoinia panamericana UAMH 10762]